MDKQSFCHEWLGFGGLTPIDLVRQTWRKSVEHELLTRASAASYFALTAFIPFLGVLLTLACCWLAGRDLLRQTGGGGSLARSGLVGLVAGVSLLFGLRWLLVQVLVIRHYWRAAAQSPH